MIRSFDLETDPIARAYLAPEPVCVSWFVRGEPAAFERMATAWPRITRWLESEDILLGANVAYDMAVLAEWGPEGTIDRVFEKYARGQVRDVLLNQKIIDIASTGSDEGHSLESLCLECGLPAPDKEGPWRLEFAALRDVPENLWPAGVVAYVLDDAERPLDIDDRQRAYESEWLEHSGGEPLLHLAGFEAIKAFVLHLIECWGVRTDLKRAKKLQRYLERYLRHGQHWLERGGLVRADGTKDTKAAKARMGRVCRERKIPISRTKGKDVSLDKEACETAGDGLLSLYSEYAQAGTLRARANDLMQGVTLPLQTRINSLLETGRTSSSKPKPPIVGFQAQNLPRKAGARECIVPRAGHVLISADLPMAELRSLSQVNIDLGHGSVMAEQLNACRDLHLWFGGQIVDQTYEAMLEWPNKSEKKAWRDQAKPCNFGFPGGMGPVNFAGFAWRTYKQRFSVERAKELKGLWLDAFPEMQAFFAYIKRLLDGREACVIRHLRSGRWRGRVRYCAACNSQFQELTANGAMAGLIETSRRAYTVRSSALYSCRPIMWTHDEAVAEAPEDQAHEAALELSAVMAEQFTRWHPDVPALPCTGPGKDPRVVAPVVSRRYSKEMEAVWSNGKLIPWDVAA